MSVVIRSGQVTISLKSVSLSNSLSRTRNFLHFDAFASTTALIVLENYQTYLRLYRGTFFICVMALFDVSDFRRYSELRQQILPSGQTRLKEPTTHYSFGLKKLEFAVPVGVDVSILILQESPGISSATREISKTARSTRRDAASSRASQVVSVANSLSRASSAFILTFRMEHRTILGCDEESFHLPLALDVYQVLQR